MPVLSRDREEDVPECSGQEISLIFPGNFRFPENAIRERRSLAQGVIPRSPLGRSVVLNPVAIAKIFMWRKEYQIFEMAE